MLAHNRSCRLDRHILITKDQVLAVYRFNRQVKKLGPLLIGPEIVGDYFGIGPIQHPFAENVGEKVGKSLKSITGIQKHLSG